MEAIHCLCRTAAVEAWAKQCLWDPVGLGGRGILHMWIAQWKPYWKKKPFGRFFGSPRSVILRNLGILWPWCRAQHHFWKHCSCYAPLLLILVLSSWIPATIYWVYFGSLRDVSKLPSWWDLLFFPTYLPFRILSVSLIHGLFVLATHTPLPPASSHSVSTSQPIHFWLLPFRCLMTTAILFLDWPKWPQNPAPPVSVSVGKTD